MPNKTKIEWADITINDQTGCNRIGPECDNCYAVPQSRRNAAMGQVQYQGVVEDGNWTGLINIHDPALKHAYKQKHQRIFWNSMSDMFHAKVPTSHLDEKMRVMLDTPWHTHLLLTKRTRRAWKYLWDFAEKNGVPSHIHIGFSAGTQASFNRRWKDMIALAKQGWIVWVSMEPLLERVQLANSFLAYGGQVGVVAGGESSYKARASHPDWFRLLRDDCAAAGMPFDFKQWGEWGPDGWVHANTKFDKNHITFNSRHEIVSNRDELTSSHNYTMIRLGKKRSGRLLDGARHSEYPEMETKA